MKLTTRIKPLAKTDSTRFIDRYLGEFIDYGGELCTRAEAIQDMQQMGLPQPAIDRWLQGSEFAQRLRQRQEKRVQLTLYCEP